MTSILAGTNRFIDCESLIALGGSPVLRVQPNPLRVSLMLPEGDERLAPVAVVENSVEADGAARVDVSESAVSIYYRDQLVLSAILVKGGEIALVLDLRPLGLSVFTEATSLRVGSSRFVRNNFIGVEAAINLA